MGQSVLFRGRDQVLRAYEMNDIGPWAIWLGKEMVAADESKDVTDGLPMLDQALELLGKGGSESVFVLRVYEPGTKKLNYTTPPSRGFPFRLYDEGASPFQSNQRMINDQQAEIARLQAALYEKNQEPDEEEEKEEKEVGFIGQLLKDPDMKRELMMGIRYLAHECVAGIKNKLGMAKQPATMAGVPGGPPSQEQIDKINAALDILEAADPLLGDHLLAIARIAKDNPGQYNMLITMLPK